MTKTAEQKWEALLRECDRRTAQSTEAKREAKRALAARRKAPTPEWTAREIRINHVTQKCGQCGATVGEYQSGPYLVGREGASAHERLSTAKPSSLQLETLPLRIEHILEERQTCIMCMLLASASEASPSSADAASEATEAE